MNLHDFKHARPKLVLALLCMTLGSVPAHAATFCAATGAQLASHLNTAASNGQDDVIKIEARTLTGTSNGSGEPRWQYHVQASDEATSLTISGGWSLGNNCASQISTSPQDTALDAAFSGRALAFSLMPEVEFSGDVVVRNLTITRASTGVSSIGAAFNWGVTGVVGSSLLLENILVVASNVTGSGSSAVHISHDGSGSAKARNLIVYGNTTTTGAPVAVTATGTAYAVLSNASIFDNSNASTAAGLNAFGVVTLANNAVADNTSSVSTHYQAYSAVGTSLTLRNNHFGTKLFTGGVSSESGTTTGNALWTQVGSIIIPDANSPLRDSGLNSPTGGLATTDFNGDARIVNGTVDRGAIEAAPVPPVGPYVVPAAPTNNSTSSIPGGKSGDSKYVSLTFTVSGGTNGGTTALVCTTTAGTVSQIQSGTQTIAIGANVNPVRVYFTLTVSPQTGTVQCTATPQGGVPSTYTYHFNAPAGAVLGPVISPVSPVEGATINFSPIMAGDLIELTINLSASEGQPNGVTSIDCFDLVGPVVVSENAAQSVITGQQPLAVTATMVATQSDQEGIVRCLVKRHVDEIASTIQYQLLVAPASGLFANDFE